MLTPTLLVLLAGAPQHTGTVTTACTWPEPWIWYAQRGDGSWSATDVPVELPGVHAGEPTDELWVSALGTLALLGDGGEEESRERAARGVAWIGACQQLGGGFALQLDARDELDHAVATLAVCEQLVAEGGGVWTAAAARALQRLEEHALPSGGWSRLVEPAGGLDPRTTAWAALALCSGRDAGFEIDVRLLADAAGALRSMHAGAADVPARDRASELLVRLLAGESPRMVSLDAAVRQLVAVPPPADLDGACHDPETVFLISLVARLAGGARWKTWREQLTELRYRLGNLPSRDPRKWLLCDPARTRGGSAAAAGFEALTLEVYFQYPRVAGVSRAGPRPLWR